MALGIFDFRFSIFDWAVVIAPVLLLFSLSSIENRKAKIEISALSTLLSRTSRLTVLFAALITSGWLVALGLLAILVAVFLDAAVGLSPTVLMAIDVLAILLLAVGVGHLIRVAIRHRYGQHRLARLIEERCGIEDNRLINGVDLAAQAQTAASPVLCAMAIAQGEALAATISPGDVVDHRPVWRAAGGAALAAIVVLTVAFVWAGVFAAVIPRYLNPISDHPPYTPVRFAVTIEPEHIHQNQSATIRSQLAGSSSQAELPDEADVVFINADGDTGGRVPMARHDDGSFVLRIERAERSCDFYIDTRLGRSQRYHMEVEPPPPEPLPVANETINQLSEELSGLLQQHQNLSTQLKNWVAQPGGKNEWGAMGENLKRYVGAAKSLDKGLDRAAEAGSSAGIDEKAAEAFRNAAAAVDSNVEAAVELLNSHFNSEGKEFNQTSTPNASTDPSLDRFLKSGEKLQQALSRMRGAQRSSGDNKNGSGVGSKGGTVSSKSNPVTTAESSSPPLDISDLNESLDPKTATNREATTAFLEGVPERFRDAAAAYFRRLAEESSASQEPVKH